MRAFQRLTDKTPDSLTAPWMVCGSRSGPRLIDAGLMIWASRPVCFRRRFGADSRRDRCEVQR